MLDINVRITAPELCDALNNLARALAAGPVTATPPSRYLDTTHVRHHGRAAMFVRVNTEYDVELIGASIEAIDRGENRQEFKKIVESLGGESARSVICHTIEDLLAGAAELGYPMVVRPSFTMGGSGSGMAYNEDDLRRIAGAGLQASPTTEILLEESILGWKEYELELMRDHHDNVVVVCSIENLDPMGVHTGDSITVAPALTLTDREYQHMRDVGIAIPAQVDDRSFGGQQVERQLKPGSLRARVEHEIALFLDASGQGELDAERLGDACACGVDVHQSDVHSGIASDQSGDRAADHAGAHDRHSVADQRRRIPQGVDGGLDGAGQHFLRIRLFFWWPQKFIEADHYTRGELDLAEVAIDGGAGILQRFAVGLDGGDVAPPAGVVGIGVLCHQAHHARFLAGDHEGDAAGWFWQHDAVGGGDVFANEVDGSFMD